MHRTFPCLVRYRRSVLITNLLLPGVQNTGDSARAFNRERKEAVVFHKSCDKILARSLQCPTASPCNTVQIPATVCIYDELSMMNTKRCFLAASCDTFNQQMSNRTFPYALPRDTNTAVAKSIWNYLFTSTLLNCWNVWKTVLRNRDSECQTPSFQTFCDLLSKEIVEKLCT